VIRHSVPSQSKLASRFGAFWRVSAHHLLWVAWVAPLETWQGWHCTCKKATSSRGLLASALDRWRDVGPSNFKAAARNSVSNCSLSQPCVVKWWQKALANSMQSAALEFCSQNWRRSIPKISPHNMLGECTEKEGMCECRFEGFSNVCT